MLTKSGVRLGREPDKEQVPGNASGEVIACYDSAESETHHPHKSVTQRKTSATKKFANDIFSSAGINVNGNQPWDIRVHHEKFYGRVFRDRSLGLGETYMDGWWDCENLSGFFIKVIRSNVENKISKNWVLLLQRVNALVMNKGHRSRAFQVGERHYDIDNELYASMLGARMVYSCAYWDEADNLYDAQEAKLELTCKKLNIRAGDRILDIGCGWGSFAKYAAEKYGARVVGITVSREQAEHARNTCLGLPVEIRLQDYRDMNELFDRIVSIGMFEHVGCKNYRTYMKVAHRCLKDGGLFLLHTIGSNQTTVTGDAWMEKYIFPNSMLPSMRQISTALEGLFVMEDWHNFGADYAKTLQCWYDNFQRSWTYLSEKHDERFYRMWKYYLLSSAAAFRARYLQVWQLVLSKDGVPGGYRPVR
jgi:cyclopropane-fatty-acyl-phospholipid synthase